AHKHPLASTATAVAPRAARKSSQPPPNRSSTRTETAEAPARSKPVARSAGSASGRRSPAEGERRLISAIAPRPGRRSASAKRNQRLQSLGGRAGLDRFARHLQALLEIRGVAPRRDSSRVAQ